MRRRRGPLTSLPTVPWRRHQRALRPPSQIAAASSKVRPAGLGAMSPLFAHAGEFRVEPRKAGRSSRRPRHRPRTRSRLRRPPRPVPQTRCREPAAVAGGCRRSDDSGAWSPGRSVGWPHAWRSRRGSPPRRGRRQNLVRGRDGPLAVGETQLFGRPVPLVDNSLHRDGNLRRGTFESGFFVSGIERHDRLTGVSGGIAGPGDRAATSRPGPRLRQEACRWGRARPRRGCAAS